MPLPTDSKTEWPPKAWRPVLTEIAEAAAWYSGDTDALADLYGTLPDSRQQVRFWATGRRDANGRRIRRKLHAPAAADVAPGVGEPAVRLPPRR